MRNRKITANYLAHNHKAITWTVRNLNQGYLRVFYHYAINTIKSGITLDFETHLEIYLHFLIVKEHVCNYFFPCRIAV